MTRSCDVLIVGGGIAGATLACALGSSGFDVVLLEAGQAPRYLNDSGYGLRVSAISPGSEAIFRELGVWPLIEEKRFCPFYEMHVWDAGSDGEIHFNCLDLAEPRLGYIVENQVIQTALHERLRTLDNVDVKWSRSLGSLVAAARDVHVSDEDGSHYSARLAVGADGPASSVRELAGISFSASSYSQTAIVANVDLEQGHAHTAWQRFLPTGPLAFLPLADRCCSIVWSADAGRAQALMECGDESFERQLTEAIDNRFGAVRLASERASFPLRGGQAEHYVQARIALVGDAAHVIHPLAGQGANLGLLDAATLAKSIATPGRDPGGLRVLRQYERTRKGENVLMMRALEGFKYLFGATGSPLRWLRAAGLNATNSAPAVKNSFMRRAMGIPA